MRWTDEAIATAIRGRGLASLAAKRLVRWRSDAQHERFAPVFQAMREALKKGDWPEFHRQGRELDRMGFVRRPMRLADREALFAKLERLCRK
jgi:hypothetical protein